MPDASIKTDFAHLPVPDVLKQLWVDPKAGLPEAGLGSPPTDYRAAGTTPSFARLQTSLHPDGRLHQG